MARAKLPPELIKAHRRMYMSEYRQRQKQSAFSQAVRQLPFPQPPALTTATHTTDPQNRENCKGE